jgi:adenine phosphoribosyltransferase
MALSSKKAGNHQLNQWIDDSIFPVATQSAIDRYNRLTVSYQRLAMSQTRESHTVQIAGLNRDLPLFEVAPGVRIAVLNILGDTELVEASARALDDKLDPDSFDVIITAEAKSIPILYALAVVTGKPWVVLRKSHKLYMGDSISAETVSITTGKKQTLYLDDKDRGLIKGRRVCLLDDVISTGSTQKGMRSVVEKAGGTVSVEAAILTEGDRDKWAHIVALGHVPVFVE